MSDVGAPPVVRIRWVEAGRPPGDLDLRSADEWQILLELDGTACAAVTLPNPGNGAGPAFLTAALLRHADGRRARLAFTDEFRARLGAAPAREYRERTCSVVISTHRRPDYLAGALEAVARLDPAPFEVIVVDNAPGDLDCRAQVEAAGARYVREDRRGLNAARAAGARAARGELVAYLDDDCVPSPGWLRQLPELFDDPLVAAVTGPAFAYELTTPAQRRRDVVAGFVHGFARSTFDWTMIRPVHSGQVGAGANMIFRRAHLGELGDPFPPDLDGGTAAISGGDLYAFYRVLAAGYRITYDPASFVLHRHRPEAEALRETVRGYGVGASAFLMKTLVEERELATFAIWRWLPQQYLVALVARAVGRGDAVTVRLRWEYFWNSFRGPGLWLAARRAARARGPLPLIEPVAPADAHAAHAPSGAATPSTTVASVILAGGDPDGAELCRVLLESETVEVVHVESRSGAHQRSEGVARAKGDVLVFLNADLIPSARLVTRYAERLSAPGAPGVVLGYNASRPYGGLAAKHDALWWEDHFTAKRDAVAVTFADFVASNMAMTRATYERVGPFDDVFEVHDDWEWGVRALRAGVRAEFDPQARAERTPSPMSALDRIARAHVEGRDEVRLWNKHQVALPPGPRQTRAIRLFTALLDRGGARPASSLLDVLETVRARRTWLALFRVALGAARERGWRQAGGDGIPGAGMGTLVVDLDSTDPIPPPETNVPVLALERRGEGQLGRVSPRRAQWHGGLADGAVGVLARRWWPEREGRWWTALPQAATARAEEPTGVAAERALVRSLDGGRAGWSEFDRAIRAEGAQVPFAAALLPGVRASDAWLEAVAPAFEADRVAVVVGAGVRGDEPPAPLIIHSRGTLRAQYASGLGRPFQYIAVSPSSYEQLGGFDLDAAAYGDYGPMLDFVERALAAGFVIGYRDTPGLMPAGFYRPERAKNEWRRWFATGALLVRSARRRERPAGWLVLTGRMLDGVWTRLVAGDSRRWWIGSRLAFLSGAVRALLR